MNLFISKKCSRILKLIDCVSCINQSYDRRTEAFIVATRDFRASILVTFLRNVYDCDVTRVSWDEWGAIEFDLSEIDRFSIASQYWILKGIWFVEFYGCIEEYERFITRLDKFLKRRNAGYINHLSERPRKIKFKETSCVSYCIEEEKCWESGM